jgi:RND family efflux transporter MFP subunit
MATAIVTNPLESPSARRRGRAALLVALCVAAAAVAAAWWIAHRKASGESAARQIQWIAPEARDLSTVVNATGTVKLKTGAEVRVGAQLSGIVRRLNVTVGSHVNQGDVIAEIDSRPVMAKVDQARSQLAQSEVSLAKAKTDYSRAEKLFQGGLIPAQQFDDTRAAFEAANALVAAALSGLAAARVDLDYVQIRAPISGTVASIATQQGETVAASFATPTFVTIIQESAMEVIAMVDEADIGNVRRGEEATFTTETYPDHEFRGVVTRIAPVATIISGVVNYEVAVSIRRTLGLKPDMTANVNIRTSDHRALLIPVGCLHRDGSQSFVYIARAAGAPVKRAVTPSMRLGDKVEIVRGLTLSDRLQSETGGGVQ